MELLSLLVCKTDNKPRTILFHVLQAQSPTSEFHTQNSKFCNSKIKNKKSLFLAIGSKCVYIHKQQLLVKSMTNQFQVQNS
jgi:hypothetical protein